MLKPCLLARAPSRAIRAPRSFDRLWDASGARGRRRVLRHDVAKALAPVLMFFRVLVGSLEYNDFRTVPGDWEPWFSEDPSHPKHVAPRLFSLEQRF